jgi:hypothetical protein
MQNLKEPAASIFGVQEHFMLDKVTESDYLLRRVCPSVCLAVRMEQIGCNFTDFFEV